MPSLLDQYNGAKADAVRLTGELSSLRESFAQVPNGDLTALLSEHSRREGEITRLTTELGAMTTRATTAETEVTDLRGQLSSGGGAAAVEEQAEVRAAQIVAGTGVAPAAAESAAVVNAGEPANFESFQAEYHRLQTESPAKGSAYYKQWGKKFRL